MVFKSNCESWQGKPPDIYQEACPIPLLINNADSADLPCSDHRNDHAAVSCSGDNSVCAVPTPAVCRMSSSPGSNRGSSDRNDRSGLTNGH